MDVGDGQVAQRTQATALGAARGAGKTCRMLDEGRRRAARGTDVVAGLAECHGRPYTESSLEGLERIPSQGRELDLDAVLRRRPEAVLVDDLAHANAPAVATNGAGRTWSNSSRPAWTSSPHRTSSTWNRSATSSSGTDGATKTAR